MTNLYTIVAVLFFLLHLVFETLASFIKYNFSSLGKHMIGVSFSNILAIVSRGCVAIFGVSIAVVIEGNLSDVVSYNYLFSFVLLLGALFSLFLSKIMIVKKSYELNSVKLIFLLRNIKKFVAVNNSESVIYLNKFVSIMMGTQFIAVVIAYGLCFVLPKHRLIITSLIPLVSMLGTMVTIFFVEPMLARLIDLDNKMGYVASKEFLRARALSFAFSAISLPVISFAIKYFKVYSG